MNILAGYKTKRNFKNTSEPAPTVDRGSRLRFVIQKHAASHLHYDFRLELGGVLKSWAVPKGLSEVAGEKRLAVMVEDHPVAYINFKGTIPKGNYGAGKVEIFDKGTFTPVNEKGNYITGPQAIKNIKAGEIKFLLHGKKFSGGYVLVQMKKDEKNWLLIKHKEHSEKNAESISVKKKQPLSDRRLTLK